MKEPLIQADKFLSGASKSFKRAHSISLSFYLWYKWKSHTDILHFLTGKKNTCIIYEGNVFSWNKFPNVTKIKNIIEKNECKMKILFNKIIIMALHFTVRLRFVAELQQPQGFHAGCCPGSSSFAPRICPYNILPFIYATASLPWPSSI